MDAKQLDALELSAKTDGKRVRIEARVPAELGLIGTFLRMFDVQDIDVITAGVRAKKGFGTDWGFISYGKDGVDITLGGDSEVVPVDAFERFTARLLRVSMDAAKRVGADEVRQSWWTKAQEDATAIIARAYPKGL